VKVNELRHSNQQLIEIILNSSPIKDNTIVQIDYYKETYVLQVTEGNKQSHVIQPKDKRNNEKLQLLLSRNVPRITYLIQNQEQNHYVVMVHEFSDKITTDFVINIEDNFFERRNKQIPMENLILELKRQFLLELNGKTYAVFGQHIHAGEDITHFILVGKQDYIQIDLMDGEEPYFMISKRMKRIPFDQYRFYLFSGDISFVNATAQEKARLETLALMKSLTNQVTSYLNIWRIYGEIEQEEAFKAVKQAGVLTYTNYEILPEGIIRFDTNDKEKLSVFKKNIGDITSKDSKIVSITSKDPSMMILNGSVEGFNEFLKKEKGLEHNNFEIKKIDKEAVFVKGNREFEGKTMSEQGFIYLSIMGDISRFDRRNTARDQILTAKNPMPHLASILEGKPITIPQKKYINPITPAVMESVFKHDPTIKQKEAIDIALNTPDIAIIQGPPGTGKTTVIRAILERLNELTDSSQGIFGKNLVSAFQHDAVENVVERIDILGIPAIKIGLKNGGKDQDSTINYAIEKWMTEKIFELGKRHPQLAKDKNLKKFEQIYLNYINSSNTIENTLQLLEQTREHLFDSLDVKLLQEIEYRMSELSLKVNRIDPKLDYLIKCIYRIPRSLEAFQDDGKLALYEAAFLLKEFESLKTNFNEEIHYLLDLSQQSSPSTQDFLKLKRIRKEILVTILPKENVFKTPKQREDILNLFNNIKDFLHEKFYQTKSGEDHITLEYMDVFENNPLVIQEALMNYISVLGATNQQSRNKTIMGLKGDEQSYDNVLIDEAARSNPLDLFIPMSLAKDRIILVGDHRQLPHIVDQVIEDKMKEQEVEDSTESLQSYINETIKKSLFEHLFETLKELEEKDGIKRTVTLDKQYRMHPTLGDFVSQNFYEKHEEPHIGSGLPVHVFEHQVPKLENKACVWMNVPIALGKERSGMSKGRVIEAQKIAEHLKSIIELDSTQDLTFGIITFYRAQVDEIYKALVKVGIAYQTEDHQYHLVERYRTVKHQGKQIEKLRIGTVDAFQGMEFDVVYLSMVRSNQLKDHTEKHRIGKFGHLMVENRLCVSMSRQKKMLIVVGDAQMVQSPHAQDAIGALVNYYQLCKEDQLYGKIFE
jgi:AAA domain